MQRRHGSCRVKSILDCTVLEVRSLVLSLGVAGSSQAWWSCVSQRSWDEDVGELRGGMKARSTSSPGPLTSPAPGSLGHI